MCDTAVVRVHELSPSHFHSLPNDSKFPVNRMTLPASTELTMGVCLPFKYNFCIVYAPFLSLRTKVL